MKITRLVAIGLIAGTSWLGFQAGPGTAQIREQQPAEFPPASYKGKQYVDSKGCVFIRAGIDGDVAWVPRVSRDRKVICGFRPSLAQETAEAPAAAPADTPAQSTQTATAPAETVRPAARQAAAPAVTPKSPPRTVTPRVVRQTAPAPKPRRVAKARAAAPAPKPQAPEQVRLLVRVPKGGLCPGASAQAQPYLQGTDMRCGPQAEGIARPKVKVVAQNGKKVTMAVPAAPVSAPVAAEAATPVAQTITTQTRIAPKHVVENRVNTRNVAVPKGYRPVWEDDRLNPHRAEQNLQGRADMLLVWTNTVPRRLIDRRTGQDVTAKMPLIYPYTSVARQRADVGEVTLVRKDGKLMKRVVRRPVLSSRSAPKKTVARKAAPARVKAMPQTKPLAAPRYVQVGTYRVQANAQRAAQTIAGMGMRARIGKRLSGGKALMSVQAGPFADTASLQRAVARLRGAGYADAFVR